MAEGDGTGITGKPDGGTEVPAWIAQLPDPMKGDKSFTSFKTLGDFAGGFLNMGKEKETLGKELETLKGQVANSLPKLPENATDEQKTKFFQALGMPAKPEEYQFPKGEGIEHDPAMISWAQGVFHRARLTTEQASAVSQAWDAFVTQMAKDEAEVQVKARSDAEAAIKKELGDKYSAAEELTKRLLKNHASPEELKFLEESKLGDHPVLIRLLFKLAQKTGEDGGIPAGTPGSGSGVKIGMNYQNMPKFGP